MGFADPVLAQELSASSMDVLRDQLGLDKKAVVEANLILTESQAASFWPIYEEYQRELGAIDARGREARQRVCRAVRKRLDHGSDSAANDRRGDGAR